MNKRTFIFTLLMVLVISLFASPFAFAETTTDENTMEESSTNIENSSLNIRDSIQSSTGQLFENVDKSDGIDREKIKETKENFSIGKTKSKIQEKSLVFLIIWIIGAGILIFIKPKWGITLLISGIIGYTIINYPEEIVGIIQGAIEWAFS